MKKGIFFVILLFTNSAYLSINAYVIVNDTKYNILVEFSAAKQFYFKPSAKLILGNKILLSKELIPGEWWLIPERLLKKMEEYCPDDTFVRLRAKYGLIVGSAESKGKYYSVWSDIELGLPLSSGYYTYQEEERFLDRTKHACFILDMQGQIILQENLTFIECVYSDDNLPWNK